MSDDMNDRLLQTLDAINAIDAGARSLTDSTLGGTDEVDPMDSFSSEVPDVAVPDLETDEETEEETDLLKDYKRSRNYTYMMQEVSLTMLKNLCGIAATTMHPKAYDSVNQLLSTMRGMNKDLMDFQKLLLDSRGKRRTLPPKSLQSDGGYVHASTDEDGVSTLTIRTRERPTTANILEVIRLAKASGKNLTELDNQMIVAQAELMDEDLITEVEPDGSSETSNG